MRALLDRQPFKAPFNIDDLALFNALCESQFTGAKRMRNPTWTTDTRHVHVIDDATGEWREFSWVKAIQGQPKRPLHVVLRKCIADELKAWRSSCDQQNCEVCGSPDFLTTDHLHPPFFEIAEEFIAAEKDIPLEDGPVGAGKIMADVDQEARWIAFHASRAVYRLLCRSCNASKGKRALAKGEMK